MNIEHIIEAIRQGESVLQIIRDEEAADDDLTFDEIYYLVMRGEVIEDYPTDKPFPSCLIMGKDSDFHVRVKL